jgi:hypothetical protein
MFSVSNDYQHFQIVRVEDHLIKTSFVCFLSQLNYEWQNSFSRPNILLVSICNTVNVALGFLFTLSFFVNLLSQKRRKKMWFKNLVILLCFQILPG